MTKDQEKRLRRLRKEYDATPPPSGFLTAQELEEYRLLLEKETKEEVSEYDAYWSAYHMIRLVWMVVGADKYDDPNLTWIENWRKQRWGV